MKSQKLQSVLGAMPNSTEIGFRQLPTNILEALIPGYGLIARFINQVTGVDITLIVSVIVLAVGLTTGLRYAWIYVYKLFQNWCTSSITIDDKDDLFRTLAEWVSEHEMARRSRRLTAVTKLGVFGTNKNGEEDEIPKEALGSTGLLHIRSWAARMPPRYDPRQQSQWFRYKGRWFNHHTTIREIQATPWQQDGEKQQIVLTCIGWSTQSIKELIQDVKALAYEQERSVTVIRHPSPKEQRRFAGAWSRANSRPSRSMDTVVLDGHKKEQLINDIHDYLHPSSSKWYASRGIPYRRGYLFHGPPGTGKSSLSFALAGTFGLDIYVVSLSETNMTDLDLNNLFLQLPRMCIVLLEDIDSAGLKRDTSDEGTEKKTNGSTGRHSWKKSKDSEVKSKNKAEKGGEEKTGETETASGTEQPDKTVTIDSLAKIFKEATKDTRRGKWDFEDKKPGITLSGLLNAIDGVASHEGRILVMTTNHKERLDAALIRPGRVDVQVEFTLATKQQMREHFIRMYSDDSKDSMNKSRQGRERGHAVSSSSIDKKDTIDGEVTPGELSLEELAQLFADWMPDNTFSPAEMQDYFIQRKKDPRKAVKEAEAWRDKVLAERKAEDEADGVEEGE